ncbi:polymer-forming cytoskeletal protein [Aequorivita sp. SDUM287046]|uniref:Polymer-forming cytoskeletal protein n=1 Tax=Aequorivita aurantiaca TaxID=3053356 RepID=A0ABT8DGS3_9FLAO|nr:polymer-forming cytoskeletal protein [Aequorivita aurantiaca]MDN3723126.1 polymer-forming cytoskeletal protein [Aequorivita aurantiaca]
MFSEKKEKKITAEPGSAQNRINEGTNLKGDITSTGFFRIDGTVEGNVKTPSKVVLGKTGVIIGTLSCENADIEGRFEGNLQVSGTLSLKSTAVIDGDVIVGKLAVETGATMNASCVMHSGTFKSNSEKDQTHLDNTKPHPYDRQQRVKKITSQPETE